MARLEFKQLLDAGVHFGHLKRKWNPNMAPYIFDEKKGIHIIDLNKTAVKLEEAAAAMKSIARGGKKVLFVATKKQAKDIVTEKVKPTGMPYVTERWSGGMLTNFGTIRRTIKKMATIDRMKTDGTFENMSKRERLQVSRQREKMEKNLGSIADLTRLPSALFVVDIVKEHIAIAEARKLGIPTFAMVDTNSDPSKVDFPIPANDDATKSIELIVDVMIAAINEGVEERKNDKTATDEAPEEGAEEAGEEVAATNDTSAEENA
ncbi:MAG: 30S ribosomal protein S2 [Flavobacteriales bacterium]|nr:30S ribosomal protein S2 [Flavobacteriales bacterium]HRH69275.1 30S ribosomal protein S2 [Flavobacteriales bacterium]